MDLFEADLAAFADWWLTGGKKPRSEATLYEYTRHVRKWRAWAERQERPDLNTLTVRSVRGYMAERRKASEWAAVGAVRALKTYSKWLAGDEGRDDPLAALEYLETPSPGLRKNLRQSSDGRWVWHWDPAFIPSIESGSAQPVSAAMRSCPVAAM